MINVTLTGIDEATDVLRLQTMLRVHDLHASKAVEFGILVSAKVGRNRYPHLDWVQFAVKEMPNRCALHICGSEARIRLKAGYYDEELPYVTRVQLNGAVGASELNYLNAAYPDTIFITQFGHTDPALFETKRFDDYHQILMDGSGGRGITPGCWSAPDTAKKIGFAGGLGPHNLASQLPLIKAVSSPGWWIDMESGVRDDHDNFDFGKAEAIIEFCKEQAP